MEANRTAPQQAPRVDLDALRDAFSGRLITEPVDLEAFTVDWRRRYFGRTLAAAQPDSVEGVAAIVRWCAQHRVAVVPQGGNTGLSGGATPDESGRSIVLSLAKLAKVRAVDTTNNSITVEAGCTLAQVHDAAREAGRLFPLSLPSEGTCTIGGNLATNAGGAAVLRYGNTRELCLGVEVVTAEGRVWNGLRGLRKDNTGYDLRDLFVGSEGTLGVITAATMKLYPLPAAQVTAMAAVQDPHAALRLLGLAQSMLGSTLTAFELISNLCLDLVTQHFPDHRRPFAEASPYYVLLETSDSESEAHANAQFEALMERALESQIVLDAVIATSGAQSRALWELRELISEAQALAGKNVKHDVSVPISSIGDFVEQTNAAMQRAFPGIRMVVFGHLGDGNLHYNVSPPADRSGREHEDEFLALQPAMNRLVHDAVVAFHGSISAEHGLGQLRRDESARYKSDVEMALMRQVKQALDPLGIMNPGKVLPPQ
ncbi:MAG: hydroxyacid dehydrogenase [Burkholderiales bacterium]|jgi:FAD/FMN-containing dehydrogenase|nr:MAG: hydroxyacid dehydrogenase [Burkholderiales bacterium]